jgi:hypothetical protein
VFVGFAPLGGVLVTLCGLVAVAGFPLDDVWHRLFGQDVTLWGPTHIQMVGGAALTTLASWILVREGRFYQSQPDSKREGKRRSSGIMRFREPSLAGALLIGLSALQAEFDFGVPQFQLVYQPILLMLAAGIALVAARVRLGRGGAIFSVAFFLLLRGALAIIVGPVLGRTTPHFPLYLVEALLVEAVALRIPTSRRLRFALASGAAIGTIGLAGEWAWSRIWMPNPWPAELLPEGAVLGFAAAVGGAVVGGFIGGALDRDQAAAENVRPAFALAGLVVASVLPRVSGSNQSATARRSRRHRRLRRTRRSSCRDRDGSSRPTGDSAGPTVVRRDVVAGARMGQRVEEARRAGADGSG